jgi:phospholipid/cholesterol/gamma-HCH transport system substrate-binding protein
MALTRRTWTIGIAALVVAGVVGGFLWFDGARAYRIELVMPSAAQLATGSPVWINGWKVGQVAQLQATGGKAVVTVDIDADRAPLHDGTTSRVEWNSALGERLLTLYPGPAGNAVIPDGGMLQADSKQIEVDQVLAALDPPTRARLTSLIGRLDTTVDGSEDDLRQTLQSAGPAVQALGEVLKGIGSDGPAIRALVTQLDDMSAVAAQRQDKVRAVVGDLSAVTGSAADEQDQLASALAQLPSTLDAASTTLGLVPGAADATVPLLEDLQPATAKLTSVARNLSPVLSDLRPAVAQLHPTLAAASSLLDLTPGLIDTAHGVLPPVQQALTDYEPAVSFLRPYSPELAGWLANWSQAFAAYDSQGHVWTGLLAPGTNAVDESLVAPPGSVTLNDPAPGQIVGQPWTDANGSGMR